MYNYLSVATVAADLKHSDQCDSRMATALTTGVISVIITGLLAASISVAVHAIVYVCAGISVLNDGIIPALDGISSNETSSWAIELFTLSGEKGRIILSFEVDSMDYDRMELAVFICPDMGINSSVVNIYFDSSMHTCTIIHYCTYLNLIMAQFSTQLPNFLLPVLHYSTSIILL